MEYRFFVSVAFIRLFAGLGVILNSLFFIFSVVKMECESFTMCFQAVRVQNFNRPSYFRMQPLHIIARYVMPLIALSILAGGQAVANDVISDGPSAKVNKNLALASRGARALANVTAEVWALGNYAYTGTTAAQCGGDPESGVWVWDVHNHNRAEFAGIIPSPPGSFAADVVAATMNYGDILVHTNQACVGGSNRPIIARLPDACLDWRGGF